MTFFADGKEDGPCKPQDSLFKQDVYKALMQTQTGQAGIINRAGVTVFTRGIRVSQGLGMRPTNAIQKSLTQ